MDNKKIGNNFEKKAEKYLMSKGYQIIGKNFFYQKSEIDLIAISNDEILVFVEVKYRTIKNENPSFDPFTTITPKKKKNLLRGARGFLDAHTEYHGFFSRFDVILILFYTFLNQEKIIHIPSAFQEGS